jgi:subtilisin family serine protease
MQDILRVIAAPESSPTGVEIRIGLIDSGVCTSHPDVGPAVEIARVSATGCDLPDRRHHGTHLAGIIAGRGLLVDSRCRGVAPAAKILSFKIIGDDPAEQERFDVLTLIDALRDVMAAGADIINLAVTFSKPDAPPPPWCWPEEEALTETLRFIAEEGILCVVAAGNDGPELGTINFPAGSPHVLTVGAIDHTGNILPISSRGPYLIDPRLEPGLLQESASMVDSNLKAIRKPDLVVPGKEIWGPHSYDCVPSPYGCATRSDGAYVCATGTSQAAAVASGLAACALEYLNNHKPVPRRDRARILRNLMISAAAEMHPGSATAGEDYGAGILLWSSLETVLSRYVNEPEFSARMSAHPEEWQD